MDVSKILTKPLEERNRKLYEIVSDLEKKLTSKIDSLETMNQHTRDAIDNQKRAIENMRVLIQDLTPDPTTVSSSIQEYRKRAQEILEAINAIKAPIS